MTGQDWGSGEYADLMTAIILGVVLWIIALGAIVWYALRPLRAPERQSRKYGMFVAVTALLGLLVPVAFASWPFAGVMYALWAMAAITLGLGVGLRRDTPAAPSTDETLPGDPAPGPRGEPR